MQIRRCPAAVNSYGVSQNARLLVIFVETHLRGTDAVLFSIFSNNLSRSANKAADIVC